MNQKKKRMIRRAVKKYKQIYPCGTKSDLLECFTEMEDEIYLWFNTGDNSTHVISGSK